VIDRKVTQGTRSDWGNRWLERFWSVLTTCEQQTTNVMTFLKTCVESFLHGLAPPPLLGNWLLALQPFQQQDRSRCVNDYENFIIDGTGKPIP